MSEKDEWKLLQYEDLLLVFNCEETKSVPLMPTAIFLELNSDEIPRTEVSKNGTLFSSWLLTWFDDDGELLVIAVHSNFWRLVGGECSAFSESSSSVSES